MSGDRGIDPGLAYIRAEAARTAGIGPLGAFWAAVLTHAEQIAVNAALDDAVRTTKPLREQELEAERIPSGLMEMRLRDRGIDPGQLRAHAESLLAKITPGPWHQGPHYRNDVESRHGKICACTGLQSPQAITNAAFIAAAPQLVRDLLTLVDQHAADLATLRAQVEKLAYYVIHRPGCASRWRAATGSSQIGPCDCGLGAALTPPPETES